MQVYDQREREWKAYERYRAGLYLSTYRQVQTRFRAEATALAAELQAGGTPAQGMERALAALTDQQDEWWILYARIYQAVGRTFAELEYGRLMKAESEVVDEWADQMDTYLHTVAGQRIVGIQSTTLQQVRRVLAEGVQEGEGIPALARRVRDTYEGISRVRSMRIARTEVVGASNRGAMVGARSTGLPLEKDWLATPGARTRETHVAAGAADPIPMDGLFLVGGCQLEHPGDTSHGASAAEIINCRCAVTFRKAA